MEEEKYHFRGHHAAFWYWYTMCWFTMVLHRMIPVYSCAKHSCRPVQSKSALQQPSALTLGYHNVFYQHCSCKTGIEKNTPLGPHIQDIIRIVPMAHVMHVLCALVEVDFTYVLQDHFTLNLQQWLYCHIANKATLINIGSYIFIINSYTKWRKQQQNSGHSLRDILR